MAKTKAIKEKTPVAPPEKSQVELLPLAILNPAERMDVEDVALAYGVRPPAIHQMLHRAKKRGEVGLRGYRLGARLYFLRAEVLAFISQQNAGRLS